VAFILVLIAFADIITLLQNYCFMQIRYVVAKGHLCPVFQNRNTITNPYIQSNSKKFTGNQDATVVLSQNSIIKIKIRPNKKFEQKRVKLFYD
jgi:hypothetical protein